MRRKVTFCMATYMNPESAIDTVKSIYECTPNEEFEIVIVDDAGNMPEEPFKEFKNLRIFHNPQRKGVGYSLDRAVHEAETDLVMFMGDDIRFIPNWFDRFHAVVRSHPTSIMSTVCAGLNLERQKITGKENHYHASHVLFHVTQKNNNKPALPFREYLECKWNNKQTGDVIQIGACLGAAYGAHRDWYLKIRGFEGHRVWGSLEIFLALRSYIAGGNCMIDLGTITGHIFKQASSNKPIQDLVYNKLLIASTLLPKDMEKIVYDWAATLPQGGKAAIQMAQRDKALFDLLAGYGRESVKKMGNSNEMDEVMLRTLIKPTGILD